MALRLLLVFMLTVSFSLNPIYYIGFGYAQEAQKPASSAKSLASKANKKQPVNAAVPAKKASSVPGTQKQQPAKTTATSNKKQQKTNPPASRAKAQPQKKTGNTATVQQNKKRAATKKKAPTKKTTARRPAQNYKGAILYNTAAKQVVFNDQADRLVPPASLTKVLTMYVALDIIKNQKISLSTQVTVSAKAAAAGGSRMGLKKGDKVTLQQLLQGMSIVSGNDASIALAEYFGKTEAGFVKKMNQKARALGMSKSTFKNASGLPAKGQFTTARDMLVLARSYLNDYPETLNKYHCFRTYEYKGQLSSNANPLLGQFAGADGLKTGYVTAAGYNLIATTKRGNIRLIGVILGAPSGAVRQREITALMEAGYGKYACAIPQKAPAQQQKKPLAPQRTQKTTSSQRQAQAGSVQQQQNTQQSISKPSESYSSTRL